MKKGNCYMPDRLVASHAGAYLTPWALVNRLKAEFPYIEADGEEGRRYVIETIERLKADSLWGDTDRQKMMERLARVKNRALFICFGDDAGSDMATLGVYVIPESLLVIEYASVEHEKPV